MGRVTKKIRGAEEIAKLLEMFDSFYRAIEYMRRRDSEKVRLEERARDLGIDADVLGAFEESLHPPGLKYPLSDRKPRRRKYSRFRKHDPWVEV